ncbi:MAG TPA: zinc ribbon domain-containing protein [Mycobacterium sp.]|nr:zinc ribbon domain-containing protein [Mycobacterium sp.]
MTQPPAGDRGVVTMSCGVCGTEVPAAAFCGACGAQLSERPGGGRGRLRMDAYAAAPGEQVVRLSVASSLFPHLPHRSRTAFRVGLAGLFLLLIALGLLRWQAPMIAVIALGLPLVFLLYLYEADIHRDLTLRSLVPTALLGIGLGVGWAFATGSLVSDFYDVSLADATSRRLAQLVGIGVPVGGAILMLVPAVVMRLVRPTRESLDGFVIGSLGAISFTGAGTLIRLAPQFATGVTAGDRPASVMIFQATVQGVAIPLTTAAMGGLVGAALWFGRRNLVVASVLATLVVFAVLGLWEVTPVLQGVDLGAHLMIAVIALLALRIGLQYCLLHEEHDAPNPGGRVLCPHCDHVVPDMAFCPNCGVAAAAASRVSRTARRAGASDEGAAPRPGYAVPAGVYEVAPVRHTTYRWLFTTLAAGLGVTVAAGVTASVLATPPRPRYTCPPDCGRPPIAEPIDINPRFVSADGEFSVQYPGPESLYTATLYPDWIELEYVGGDTGLLDLWGESADKRTAKQVIDKMIADYYPDATLDYEIPNAMVGYEPGYGAVFDDYPQDSSGEFTRLRIVALSAVKNDYALVATAVGPYHEFTPDFGTGHPSGVNLQLAMDMGKYVNSFRWRSGPST